MTNTYFNEATYYDTLKGLNATFKYEDCKLTNTMLASRAAKGIEITEDAIRKMILGLRDFGLTELEYEQELWLVQQYTKYFEA